MSRTVSSLQRESEIKAVRRVLKHGKWVRPGHIASQTNLNTAVVLSALRTLGAERRAYTVPRLHHGADRIRKTNRLIIEYRLPRTIHLSLFPSFLLHPPKEAHYG